MLKKRRAQNISISVLIAAIIGLIVLVVLTNIFSTKSGETVRNLESCAAKGGRCTDSNSCVDGFVIRNTDCESESFFDPFVGKDITLVCCIKIE